MLPLKGAVKSQGGRTFVSVVSDPPKMIGNAAVSLSSLPATVPVETGLENDDYVEIVSGLKEGDAVVVKTVAGDSGEATPTGVRTSTGGNMMMFQGSGMSAPRMR
jgi:multidrug efflux pump subunit AcrA (membrane-fusion protein)